MASVAGVGVGVGLGVTSSLVMVDEALLTVSFTELAIVTVNDSFGSTTVSPCTFTVIVEVELPAGMVAEPDG
jgi:hypothetical protein